MRTELEISRIDRKHEGHRMRCASREKQLLASVLERGIEEPLSGILEESGQAILLDGFKRLRCAEKLGLFAVPFVSLGVDESEGIETYPFDRQPALAKKRVMELFDSMSYLNKRQNVIFVGPTGAGKTGLATAMLIHAINKGATGRFIPFPDLLSELYQSSADHSEQKVLKKFLSYDCLVIDEMGYVEIDPHQAGLFFTLMKRRHKKATTILTTQLGFKEWSSFLKNPHMTAALVDRLTENSQLLSTGTVPKHPGQSSLRLQADLTANCRLRLLLRRFCAHERIGITPPKMLKMLSSGWLPLFEPTRSPPSERRRILS